MEGSRPVELVQHQLSLQVPSFPNLCCPPGSLTSHWALAAHRAFRHRRRFHGTVSQETWCLLLTSCFRQLEVFPCT